MYIVLFEQKTIFFKTFFNWISGSMKDSPMITHILLQFPHHYNSTEGLEPYFRQSFWFLSFQFIIFALQFERLSPSVMELHILPFYKFKAGLETRISIFLHIIIYSRVNKKRKEFGWRVGQKYLFNMFFFKYWNFKIWYLRLEQEGLFSSI